MSLSAHQTRFNEYSRPISIFIYSFTHSFAHFNNSEPERLHPNLTRADPNLKPSFSPLTKSSHPPPPPPPPRQQPIIKNYIAMEIQTTTTTTHSLSNFDISTFSSPYSIDSLLLNSFNSSVQMSDHHQQEQQRQKRVADEHSAAVKVQKVYRSYRTRRRLADSAVVAEEMWLVTWF